MAKIGRRFQVTKAGKVARKASGPDASAQQRQKPGGSQKVRVAKPAPRIARAVEAAQLDLEDCIRRSFMRKGQR